MNLNEVVRALPYFSGDVYNDNENTMHRNSFVGDIRRYPPIYRLALLLGKWIVDYDNSLIAISDYAFELFGPEDWSFRFEELDGFYD